MTLATTLREALDLGHSRSPILIEGDPLDRYLDPLHAVCGQNGHSFSAVVLPFLLPFLMLCTRVEIGYPGCRSVMPLPM